MDDIADTPRLQAPRFGLLLARMPCHFCNAPTPTAAVWVPEFQEIDDEAPLTGGPALLRFIEAMDEAAIAQVQFHAPWLRMAHTRTSGTTYLAHHCATCGSLQGDHFVFSPNGPYWPQDDAALARLRLIPCEGPLDAQACAGESAWMERVEDVCARE